MLRALAPLSLAGLVLLGAALASASRETSQEPRLPANWSSRGPLSFERFLEREFVESPGALTQDERALLAESLAGGGQQGVRAAVLLARSGDPQAPELILRRLEERAPAPGRADDAADAVAAAALAHAPAGCKRARAGERLEALCIGPQPHPDLEVRVESGAAALDLGRAGSAAFLLQVLRIGTHAGLADEWDTPPGQHTTWARSRAAEALSRAAGIPCSFAADASIAAREAEIANLASRLR